MPTEKTSMRIDFVHNISFDKETGKLEFTLVPSPKRYELKKIDGEEGYYDLFDKLFIPMKLLKELTSQLNDMPVQYSPPKIDNANEYILSRISYIRDYFKSKKVDYQFSDLSEEFLKRLEKDKMRFVVLSIDLKGSTKLSQELLPETHSDIVSLFLREMALIVDIFKGYVLKFTGDGVLAYFPEPNFIGMNDNAIDCAVTMKKMVLYGINPVLKENKLPELSFRIGLDSGEAMIKTIGVESIKMQKDLIGETVNLAAKIQSRADTNQILMGESTVLNVQTFWREKITKLEKVDNWEYKNKETGTCYDIYRLVEKW